MNLARRRFCSWNKKEKVMSFEQNKNTNPFQVLYRDRISKERTGRDHRFAANYRVGWEKKKIKEVKKNWTHNSVASPASPDFASFVTMGFKSVPFLLFLPPLPLAAEAATLAICLPLFNTALVRSMLSMLWRKKTGLEVAPAESESERGGAPGCEVVGGRK